MRSLITKNIIVVHSERLKVKVMKAVVLAAGIGNRMENHTENTPKTLICVGGKPIISYILESLASNGIEEVIIVTGFQEEKIKKLVGDGSSWSLRVEYIHNRKFDTTNNIYSLYLVEEVLLGDDFIIVNTDLFFHPGILRKFLRTEKKGLTLMIDDSKKLGEEEMKVSIKDSMVVDISKKLGLSISHGEYIGMAMIASDITNVFFITLREVLESYGTDVFYEKVFKRLIENEFPVKFETTGDYPWIEIDTPDDLMKAETEIAPWICVGGN